MVFEADVPVRARRPAAVGFILFGVGIFVNLPAALIRAFAPIDYLYSESWEIVRNASLIASFAALIASIVFMLVGGRIAWTAKKKREDASAQLRQDLITAGEPPPESFPADPRPDTRKYVVATVVLLFSVVLTPNLIVLLCFGVAHLPLISNVMEPLLWTLLALGAIVTLGSIVALPLVNRARQDENAMWEMEQRQAREAYEARAGGQTDTLPEGGPTLPE